MPRSTPYYVEDRARRLARRPYDYEGPQAEVVSDSASDEDNIDGTDVDPQDDDNTHDVFDLHDLGPALEEEREHVPNIFNPTDARNNCANLAMGYVSGLPVDDIDGLVGPGPDEDEAGISYEELERRAQALNIELSESPPDGYYMEGAREAAVAYELENGDFHFVAMDGGDDERNYTYSDHQVLEDEDVTDNVRAARGRRLYMTRRQFDDPENESESSDEEEDWER